MLVVANEFRFTLNRLVLQIFVLKSFVASYDSLVPSMGQYSIEVCLLSNEIWLVFADITTFDSFVKCLFSTDVFAIL